MMMKDLKVTYEKDYETDVLYPSKYELNGINLLPSTHEFDTLEDYLKQLEENILSIRYTAWFEQGEEKAEEAQMTLNTLYKTYFDHATGNAFFISKTQHFKNELNYALRIAQSKADWISDRDAHYDDWNDRENSEYSSLNSNIKFLLNAKKEFETTGEMDQYVLELAKSLQRRYDNYYI